MKKIFTFLAVMVCTISLSAKTIYLNTGGADFWEKDQTNKFAVWAWQGSSEGTWSAWMTNVSGNVWSATIGDNCDKVIFARFNTAETTPSWNNGAIWNKTGDLAIPAGCDLYTITAWDPSDATAWSTYGETPTPTPTPGGEKDYFLKGWSGKDIETPTADEQFENGMLTYNVVSDEGHGNLGYFFILVCEKNQVIGEQYMTAEYTTASHATMVKNGSQKMGVPAGTVTFYLYDNEDGTYELSTAPIAGKKLVDSETSALQDVSMSLDLNAPMYNVIGQPVDATYHGIVIQNGRKYVR